MLTKKQALSVFGLLIVSFAIGRYSSPSKIVETEKLTTNTDSTTDINKDTHRNKITKTTIVKNKDGSETITKISKDVADTNTISKNNTVSSSAKETTKETTYSKGSLNLSALAAKNVHSLTSELKYGGMVSRNILGPITMGAFGLTDGTIGVSMGLSF